MQKINLINVIKIIAAFFAFTSCEMPADNSNNSQPFVGMKNNMIKDSIFYFVPKLFQESNVESCYGGDFKIKYWKDYNMSQTPPYPELIWEGSLVFLNDSLLYRPSDNFPWKLLFDFSAKEIMNDSLTYLLASAGSDSSIPSNIRFKYEAKYVGFDKGEKSEICSVKIYDYPFFSYNPNNKNLTIYFSKRLGITGLYLSHDKTNRKPFSVDTIQDHVGKLYFDIIMGEGFYMEPKFKYYE